MTTNLSINPDEGSSVPLQRWLDVLRGGLRSSAEAVGLRADTSAQTGAVGGVRGAGEVRLPWSLDHRDRAELRAAGVSESDRARRISRAALDAHAATGELEVQRAAYAGLERAVGDSIAAVRERIAQVQAAAARTTTVDRSATPADTRSAANQAGAGAFAPATDPRTVSAQSAAGQGGPRDVAGQSASSRGVDGRDVVTGGQSAAAARATENLALGTRIAQESAAQARAAQVSAIDASDSERRDAAARRAAARAAEARADAARDSDARAATRAADTRAADAATADARIADTRAADARDIEARAATRSAEARANDARDVAARGDAATAAARGADARDAAARGAARSADVATADARSTEAATSAARTADARDAAARADEQDRSAAAAGIEAATEVAKGRDRLVALRDRAMEESREVAMRVNALADDIAEENRRVAEQRRAGVRAQERAEDIDEARSRRDQAVREIARLTGATATTASDGTVEVALDGHPLVDADGAHELAVRLVREASARLDAMPADPDVVARDRGADAADARGTLLQPDAQERIDRSSNQRATDSPDARYVAPPRDATTREVPGAESLARGGAESSRADSPSGSTDTARLTSRDLAGQVHVVPRLTWTEDGTDVAHPGGQIAAQLDHAGRVLPEALTRWEAVGSAVATAVAAASAGPSDDVAGQVGRSDSVAQATAAASRSLDDVAAALLGRSQMAERRLDVMSVVDAVLVGAPMSQLGGLVSTALGGRADGGTALSGHSGQQLVSALQAVDAVTVTLGRTAGSVAESLTSIPSTFTSSAPGIAQLVPTPDALTGAPAGTPPGAPAGTLPGAPAGTPLGAPAGTAAGASMTPSAATPAMPGAPTSTDPAEPGTDPAGSAATAQMPAAGFAATVSVTSVAGPAIYASTATFDPAARFERPFAVGFTVGAGTGSAEPPRRTVVGVGAGAGIEDVAAAITASAAGIRADVAPAGNGRVRLTLTTERLGAEVSLRAADAYLPGRPSDAIGGFARIQRGTDTVVQVTPDDGDSFTATSSTDVVDGVVPGARLLVGDAAAAQSPQQPAAPGGPTEPVRLSVRPDAEIAAQHASTLVAGAAAVLDTIHGRAAVDAGAATSLAQDPVVAVVATRLTSAFAGQPGQPGQEQFADRQTPHERHGLPGVRVDAEDRLRLDPRVFRQAFAEDSPQVSAQLRAVADDLVRVAGDATDPRSGALAVRILGEQSYAREYSEQAGDVDERTSYRQELLEKRADAMTSLLERLGDEQRWLDLQLR